jgi:hypothetical protein
MLYIYCMCEMITHINKEHTPIKKHVQVSPWRSRLDTKRKRRHRLAFGDLESGRTVLLLTACHFDLLFIYLLNRNDNDTDHTHLPGFVGLYGILSVELFSK